MSSHPEQVVVTPAGHSILALQTMEVHHREYPEAHGEGRSPEEAAERLADMLVRTLDCASGPSGVSPGREPNRRMSWPEASGRSSHLQPRDRHVPVRMPRHLDAGGLPAGALPSGL